MVKDRFFSVIVLVISLLLFIETYRLPEKQDWMQYSGASYPRVILFFLIFFSIILLIRSIFLKKESLLKSNVSSQSNSDAPAKKDKTSGSRNVILIFIITGSYIGIMPLIGFIPSTILYMLVTQGLLMGIKEKRLIIKNILVSVFATFSIYYIFNNLLQILLP
jgi:putative tricarboxylic transport membrane protein